MNELPIGKSDHKVPNLERGLSVIELLSDHPEGMIGSEIAGIIEIPRNSAGRILAALTDRGFLERDGRTKKFFLTQKLMFLGRSVVFDKGLIEESLEEMRALRDELGETVMLSSCSEIDGVVLEQVPALHQVRLSVDPGARFPLHCSSPGKLSLSHLDDEKLQEILQTIEMPAKTASTITSPEAMMAEIQDIRERGYALDREEGIKGACCVSASIRNRMGGHIAELTVVSLSLSLSEERSEEVSAILKRHADNITRRLGG